MMKTVKNTKACLLWSTLAMVLIAGTPYSGTGRDLMGASPRGYNGWYTGAHTNRVAFPLGGVGAGMICLEGTGAISHVSLRNQMEVFNEPCAFAALCVKGPKGNVAKVLEGQVPRWKIFGRPGAGNGGGHSSHGFPRFEECRFLARFPFATIQLTDSDIPLGVQITGWSPFIPGDADNSSLPVAALEYAFSNPKDHPIEAVFSYNTTNFMSLDGGGDRILPLENGLILWQQGSEKNPEREGACAFFVAEDKAVVDHGWFKGGWWDSLTITWDNIQSARLMDNPPIQGSSRGGSLFVPMTIEPGQTKTVRLLIAWYVPETKMRYGQDATPVRGPAFGTSPSAGTAPDQQSVSGYLGKGLVNTFDPAGDQQIGTLTSPEFQLTKKFMQFLIGGGNHAGKTCMNLLVDGKVVQTATGANSETLKRTTWDLTDYQGKQAKIQIVDAMTGAWGHVNVDHIVLTDRPDENVTGLKDAIVLNDFEAPNYGNWVAEGPEPACCPEGVCDIPTYHSPWYAGQFSSISDLANMWRSQYHALREKSALFRDTFYDTSLPPEVVEAVAANLTILKSPTVHRQKNGRLWCWEGCCDDRGCCAGSCTHVWNYAQAMCHLFPDLERSLRMTEFHESQGPDGHQTFRSALPIRPVAHTFHAAADGQLGGIMKVHRDWRISGDTTWLRTIWPQVRQSLDYCIATWDPRHQGILEEPHHNTYDIEYWGPDGHCTTFYLGALAAAVEMGQMLGEDVAGYQELFLKGKTYLENELYNGEYFIQKIQTEGINAHFQPLAEAGNGTGYRDIITKLNQQGPKYQYGTGCLSDGVLGLWIARMCGLGQLVDGTKVKSNLNAIHRYNFKPDLTDHVNPQRPTFACGKEGGLLLCTWPHGGQLSIPFVYSDEVWTGIEYQVASHLMMEGMVEQGLEIVRACRDRYDGRVRNPFNEYECGHWYARAMSSYGLIQGLTG
ncbi:MAG: hypothetical protein JW829_06275, partial [Pirellulales bacterium]|nr:hypothetical protein [Pirellulales bacterium]